ncbi:ABC transporter ATP-binding protein [Proteiniborus sp. MB09-C3]|uniref:ABC transporter ATP-binding protein n=1 Tax=Proteiniborus sp. MB09-C3 TaxID=3050072 RepID=UPI002556C521|nr:ABC transporter ATP-binding protein [Proteiniborus sp. MB09-C3]WIV13512.1 ABC transporter ATP-binding protein [Proteiniborus sp. MB09-C3]
MADEILRMEGITKIYPNGVVANKDINFSVKAGEIHALVGENGAGKSTLMKILFGLEPPEEGQIFIKGSSIKIDSPAIAIKNGIGMVHQHFMLVPSLTVAENMVLGMEPRKKGLMDFEKAMSITREISKKYNLIVDPKAKVSDLPVGIKQRVEILKALLRGAEILILDEPTAVLTPQETQELFTELITLKEKGHTIIFISHKLKEIKEICDRITILRNGKSVGVYEINDMSQEDISRLMIGRDVILKIEKEKSNPKETVLKVNNIDYADNTGKKALNDISFTVRSGEILGIAGIEGNGQRELVKLITGLCKYNDGNITIRDKDIKNLSIKQIRELGTSHISEDRMSYGVAGEATIEENIISDRYDNNALNKRGLLNINKLQSMVNELVKDYRVKCDNGRQKVKMLSGGNIQKVVVAREFSSSPKLIIADQPTRGIDVGATEFIHRKLVKLRDEGTAVLLISADLNEVMELSDSLLVMYGGEIVAYIEDSTKITEEELGRYMLGINKQSPEEIRRAVNE